VESIRGGVGTDGKSSCDLGSTDEDIFKSCIQGSDVTLERPLVD
jgi:hypothetical protein